MYCKRVVFLFFSILINVDLSGTFVGFKVTWFPFYVFQGHFSLNKFVFIDQFVCRFDI